jgi:hypothetical protein
MWGWKYNHANSHVPGSKLRLANTFEFSKIFVTIQPWYEKTALTDLLAANYEKIEIATSLRSSR